MKYKNHLAKLERRQSAYDEATTKAMGSNPQGVWIRTMGGKNTFVRRPGSQSK